MSLPFYSQPNVRLSRMQGLYQGVAHTMGSSQIHSSCKYSSEWKSLLPGLSMIEGSETEQRQESIFARVWL